MSLNISMIVLFCLHTMVMAQTPDWVKKQGKSFRHPDHAYLTGFGMATLTRRENQVECQEMAANHARSNLIQKIRVTIRSAVASRVEERDTKLSEYFSTTTQTTASLEIEGLELETFYDKKKKLCYAFAYVGRERLARFYGDKADGFRKEIRAHLAAGKWYEEGGQRTKALDEYLACYPLFRQLEEAQAVLSSSQSDLTATIAELDAQVSTDEVSRNQVREAVERLVEKPLASPDDVAWYLAYCLSGQLETPDQGVLVTPFTYQDTRMGSPFSRFFMQVMENKIVEVARWQAVQQATTFEPKTRNMTREFAQASGATHVLTGTYWEQPKKVRFLATLRRVADSKVMASAVAVVDSTILRQPNLTIRPRNFSQAFSDRKAFNTDEVIGGGLHLEVWTNKGVENLLYTEGERMQVYVRVNMPCYIRFIYHLADGYRTLLLDNYYIDGSKVNKVYLIPEEFECSAPFGAEVLQVFARSEKFDSIETRNVDGHDILAQDLQRFLTKTRGFKKAKRDGLQAESRLVITTMRE
ncbi:MAG: DUF4384 domain-containing protein [bacterium]